MTASNPPPGWYPDPAGSGADRWWDGWAWTTQLRAPVAAPTPHAPPGRPSAAVVMALLAIAALMAVVAWQLLAAMQPPPPRTPSPVPPPMTASPAPTVDPRLSERPEPSFDATPTGEPTLRIDPDCPKPAPGTLRAKRLSTTLPAGWRDAETQVTFDCAATAVGNATGFGEVSVAAVDPSWGLDEEQIIAWVWDDLGLEPRLATDEQTMGELAGHPAVLVTRSLREVVRGESHETTLRLAVVAVARGEREVIVTAQSIPEGRTDEHLSDAIAALWKSVRVDA